MRKIMVLLAVLGLSPFSYAGSIKECDRSAESYVSLVKSTTGPDEKIDAAHFYSGKLDICFVILSYDSSSGVAYSIADVDKRPVEGDFERLYGAFVWIYGEPAPRTCFVWGKAPCTSKKEWVEMERRDRPF